MSTKTVTTTTHSTPVVDVYIKPQSGWVCANDLCRAAGPGLTWRSYRDCQTSIEIMASITAATGCAKLYIEHPDGEIYVHPMVGLNMASCINPWLHAHLMVKLAPYIAADDVKHDAPPGSGGADETDGATAAVGRAVAKLRTHPVVAVFIDPTRCDEERRYYVFRGDRSSITMTLYSLRKRHANPKINMLFRIDLIAGISPTNVWSFFRERHPGLVKIDPKTSPCWFATADINDVKARLHSVAIVWPAKIADAMDIKLIDRSAEFIAT